MRVVCSKCRMGAAECPALKYRAKPNKAPPGAKGGVSRNSIYPRLKSLDEGKPDPRAMERRVITIEGTR